MHCRGWGLLVCTMVSSWYGSCDLHCDWLPAYLHHRYSGRYLLTATLRNQFSGKQSYSWKHEFEFARRDAACACIPK